MGVERKRVPSFSPGSWNESGNSLPHVGSGEPLPSLAQIAGSRPLAAPASNGPALPISVPSSGWVERTQSEP